MLTEFLSPSDPRWPHVLDRVPHDVYHLPEYVALCAREESAIPVAFYATACGREFLIPLLLKTLPEGLPIEPGWMDATSPYGYAAPLSTETDRDWIEQSLIAFRTLAREQRILTAFLRLHPFCGVPHHLLSVDGVEIVEHGPVVYVDLNTPPQALWAAMRAVHRRHIRKLLAAGFTSVVDDWRWYDGFIELYRSTMERVRALPFYFFSDSYFYELRDKLGSRLHLLSVHAPDGELASAGLLMTTADVLIQYHLGATATRFLSCAPSKLVINSAIEWGRGRGATTLNLGGGRSGCTDSLFEFKTGFGGSQAPFHTLRMVLDPRTYTAVTDSLLEIAPSAERGFFPAYRAPSVHQRSDVLV